MRILLAALALLATAGCATRLDPAAELAAALDGRQPAAPVRCLDLADVRGVSVIDGTAILYDTGRALYVNRPTAGRNALRTLDILSTRTFAGRICRGEPVDIVDGASGMQRGFVLLGDFVPYRRPR